MKRPGLCACVLAGAVAACGGESRSRSDGPAPPDVAGSAWTLPTKDGIPIGDCTEPSASELMRDGCPASESDGLACALAQEGSECRYSLETQPAFTSAVQHYTVCLDGRWVPGAERCSDMCHSAATGIDSVHFDISDCATRARLTCAPGDPTIVPRPTAQNLMDDELEALVESCAASKPFPSTSEIHFENGCPSELLTSSSPDQSVVECLVSKLTGVRYDCAVPLACSFFAPIAI